MGAEAGASPNPAGTWRLVFGTATKFRPFQYIPVDEDFVINMADNKLALESSIGPFSFHVKGPINGWDAATGVLSFQFTQVDILFAGNKVRGPFFGMQSPAATVSCCCPGQAAGVSTRCCCLCSAILFARQACRMVKKHRLVMA
jgi:hypothetical protein